MTRPWLDATQHHDAPTLRDAVGDLPQDRYVDLPPYEQKST
jgi:hypothetical protein